MFSIKESENLLKKELSSASCLDNTNMNKVWSQYKRFSEYKFDCEFDILAWEVGICSWTEKPTYYCSIIRNFYDNTSILAYVGLYFYFELNDTLKELEDYQSQSEFESAQMFLAKIEKRDSFTILQSNFIPTNYEIGYEDLQGA